jgi:hypothetical protein
MRPQRVRVKTSLSFPDGTGLKEGCELDVHEILHGYNSGFHYVCRIAGVNKDWFLSADQVESVEEPD